MKRLDSCYRYVVVAYLTFWLMVLVICGGASMLFNAPPVVMRILSNICAWSPTLVLFFMYHRLRPNNSIGEFLREAFRGKIHPLIIVLLCMTIVGATCLTAFIVAIIQDRSFTSYFTTGGYTILASFIFSILSGPTGEEAGWRGYLRVELNKKYSFTKASIIQGVIWAFWHTVLWFVDSDFLDIRMIPYVISNVVVMTCLAFIMNIILEKYNNLIYAIAIHFSFNIVYCFLQVDILFYEILIPIYLLMAVIFGIIFFRNGKVKI